MSGAFPFLDFGDDVYPNNLVSEAKVANSTFLSRILLITAKIINNVSYVEMATESRPVFVTCIRKRRRLFFGHRTTTETLKKIATAGKISDRRERNTSREIRLDGL